MPIWFVIAQTLNLILAVFAGKLFESVAITFFIAFLISMWLTTKL